MRRGCIISLVPHRRPEQRRVHGLRGHVTDFFTLSPKPKRRHVDVSRRLQMRPQGLAISFVRPTSQGGQRRGANTVLSCARPQSNHIGTRDRTRTLFVLQRCLCPTKEMKCR